MKIQSSENEDLQKIVSREGITKICLDDAVDEQQFAIVCNSLASSVNNLAITSCTHYLYICNVKIIIDLLMLSTI